MRYNEQSNPTGIFEASTTVSILFSLINAILIFKSICILISSLKSQLTFLFFALLTPKTVGLVDE